MGLNLINYYNPITISVKILHPPLIPGTYEPHDLTNSKNKCSLFSLFLGYVNKITVRKDINLMEDIDDEKPPS
jgi:hypothetical protein